MKKNILILLFLSVISISFAFSISGNPKKWSKSDLVGFDKIGDAKIADISSLYLHKDRKNTFIRITFNDMVKRHHNEIIKDNFINKNISLNLIIKGDNNVILLSKTLKINAISDRIPQMEYLRTLQNNMLEMKIDKKITASKIHIIAKTFYNDELSDIFDSKDGYRGGNCAFVHHGNQGLTYTEVFYGQYPQDESGYDELLQVHQATGIPGNFHMSGTLMPAAQWHNPEFNEWLKQGIQDGYVAMTTSALGQHIMPFVTDEMNNWSVAIEEDMINYVYNYDAKVAWIPERVWLAQGHYPDAGVADWLGDNWAQHGIEAVILDDTPHLNGSSNLKIHWMNNGSGVNLRVIPINNDFVGKMMYDLDGAKNLVSSTGQYGIAVYGTDWEVAAEMNEHHDTNFLDNYENMIWWLHDNYPGVNAWKLDQAIYNSDFDGNTAEITPGTYWMLGGDNGYGGSDNSWYTHWASTVSHSDFHNPNWNYGYIWDNAFNHLMQAPNNGISQLGWYTMMINLHETGWHDGEEISGWEHRYSSHIKNANVYATASFWANNEFEEPINSYWDDIDRDGTDELIMYNDKLFAVFETIGARASWVFIKDESGNAVSVVGSDVAYYPETDGDYNEASNIHFAALSDVNPNYQNDIYDVEINQNSATATQVSFNKNNLHRVCELNSGDDYITVTYQNNAEVYVKSGFTPDLLELIWNGKAHIQRMWGDYGSYCGRRNSSSGATAAMILGNGGSTHSGEFEGTLVEGDEIHGDSNFKFYLYAGFTDEPYDENQNKVVKLDSLANILSDDISPEIVSGNAYKVGSDKILLVFSEEISTETGENISNYQLNGFSGNYSVQSATLHHLKGVTLKLNTNLEQNENGTIIVSNVEDLNGNAIQSPNNTANLTEITMPHITGNMNEWNPASHDYEFTLQNNGVWKATLSLDTGDYEYKIIESDSWDGNDWPAENQSFTLTEAEDITVFANCGLYPFAKNGDEFVFHSPNPPIVCGNFLSEIGGTDWDVESILSVLNDNGNNGDENANDGLYSVKISIPTGNYEYKIALNNNWSQSPTGNNLMLNLSHDSDVTFIYDMAQNGVSTQIQNYANDSTVPQINLKIGKVYPNPFIKTTNKENGVTISYFVPKGGITKIEIYNLKGQQINIIDNSYKSKGVNLCKWNLTDAIGKKVSSGVYFVKIMQNGKFDTQKFVVIK